MKRICLIIMLLASHSSFADCIDLLPNQVVKGCVDAFENSDGSITLVEPYVMFNGEKVLINGRTIISADKDTLNATELRIGWKEPNISYMYITDHAEVICQVALGKSASYSNELKDKRGRVTTAPIVSLDKDGRINTFSDKGFAMGSVTCR